jgi:hypothetical protein
MTYDGDVLGVEGARVGAPLHLVLVDLRAAKSTVEILSALQARSCSACDVQRQPRTQCRGAAPIAWWQNLGTFPTGGSKALV